LEKVADRGGTLRADARANRERILAAARDLFAERGLDVDMRQVAQRACVGLGTLYRNFATRDEFVSTLVAEVIAQIESALDSTEAIDDPLAAIAWFLNRAFDIAEANGGLIAALRQAPGVEENKDQLTERASRLWQRAAEAGVLQPGLDAALLSDFVAGLFDTYLALSERHGHAAARKTCIGILLHGICRQVSGGDAPRPREA
jgi:AcrR family transcriptional regulator